MEAKAVGKYIRISPQKARLVADVVRGMEVDKALTTLRFMPKKGAGILRKVIESAVANATQNDQVDVDDLFVKIIMIDGGPSLKRISPRAMGRATGIIKRTSHITVILGEN
jgi:large subunit ribosomal protein L22